MSDNDALRMLTRFAASTRYEELPAELLRVTKDGILDVLGVTIAASTLGQASKQVVQLVREWGGKEESTVIPYGYKVPCVMAAFANGSLAHDLDYDDIVDELRVHPSLVTVPAALATAEHVGKVNGKELLVAVAVGKEIICRLASAVVSAALDRGQEPGAGWLLARLLSTFAATATAGRMLSLSEEELANAFGIALNQTAGTMELVLSVNNSLRGLYAGFTAQAGVLSALLAGKGITASTNSLEGKAGLFPVYFRGVYDGRHLTDGIGKTFKSISVTFKPWPTCRATHGYVDAALQLVTEHNILAEDVKQVTVFFGDSSRRLCEPLEGKRKPATIMDAKYSIPFAVGTAIVKRRVHLEDCSLEAIARPEVLAVTEKVVLQADAELKYTLSGKVSIDTGRVYSRKVQHPRGHPTQPMGRDELQQKFRNCLSYSAKPITGKNVEAVIAMIDNLENIDNVGEVVELLAS